MRACRWSIEGVKSTKDDDDVKKLLFRRRHDLSLSLPLLSLAGYRGKRAGGGEMRRNVGKAR